MPKITFIEPNGVHKTVDAKIGATLMETAVDHDVEGIIAACGGSCSCSTCHVYVADDWLSRTGGPHNAEDDTLDLALERRPNSRLSCQIPITGEFEGLVVTVAEQS